MSCHTSERWFQLFANTACGTEQGVTWGPFTFLPPGKVWTTQIYPQGRFFISSSLWLMSGFFTQNQSNTLTLPIQCTVNVASYRETAVRIAGTLRIDTLHAVSAKLKTCMHKWEDSHDLWQLTHAFSLSIHLTVFLFWLYVDDSFVAYQLCYAFLKTWCMFWFPLQLNFKILELVTSASVQLPSSTPMFLHEERPVRHVSQQLIV